MTTRTDRRSTTTTFTYDAGWKIQQSSINMGSGNPAIVTQLRPAESKGVIAASGLSSTADTSSAYSLIDGPRTDVGDSTRFWLDFRFGAPVRITDGLGNTTLLSRTNATYSALVTRVQRPNGHVQRVVHDARGHMRLVIDSGGIVAGRPDTTRYEWNNTFDLVERVVPQMKDSVTRSYDPSTGNLLWEQDARGASSRVNYRYYASGVSQRHLLRAIEYPGAGTPTDSFAYNPQLNLSYARTPLGFVTSIQRDAVGRDMLTVSPIDATHNLRQSRIFDIVDQITREESVGNAPITYTLPGSGLSPDTAQVRNDTLVRMYTYDEEGNRTSVSSYSSGGKTDVGTAQSFTYDRANRLLTTNAGSGPRGYTYDPAGNATGLLYSTGLTVTQQFDALNRMTRRVVPQRDFPGLRCQGFPVGPISDPNNGPSCQLVFPYYPNNGSGYRIAADTSLFVYNSVGDILQANNRYARIRRNYTLNGLIAADSLIYGVYSTPTVNGDIRRQLYSYDRNGRRSTMNWTLGASQYQYTGFGALQSVSDPGNNLYKLVYDPLSRVDSLLVTTSGGSTTVREKRTYDLDSRLVWRERVSIHGPTGQLYQDSLYYDHRGKVIRGRNLSRAQQPQEVRYTYDPHGAVVAQELTRAGGAYQVQEFRNDAYGNVFYQRTRSSAGGNDVPFRSTYGPDGLLMEREAVLPVVPTQNQNAEDLVQTSVGSDVDITSRLVRRPQMFGGAWIEQLAGRNYFSADNRLMVVQRYDAFLGSSTDLGTWEEYRYDALGRKILTRTRRDFLEHPASSHFLCLDPAGGSCGSYVERTEWDADRILVEWRTAEGTPNGMTQGTAGYMHLEGLDHPVAVIRTDGRRVINYTWRGLGESSVFVGTGQSGDCAIFVSGCAAVNWPGKTQGGVYYTPNVLATGPSGPYTWFGTLIDNGGGTSGLLYRRNRYFDVVTGRFTQQDPIGVAGGMNLYGFAGGDPVNVADPFGLCPQWLTGRPCSGAADLGASFVPGLSTGLDAATLVSGQNPLTGENVGLLGRGIALAGLATPAAGGQIRGLLSGAKHVLSKGLLRITAEFSDKALLKTYRGAIDQINRHKEILAKASSEQINSIMKDIVKHEKRLQAAVEEMHRRGISP